MLRRLLAMRVTIQPRPVQAQAIILTEGEQRRRAFSVMARAVSQLSADQKRDGFNAIVTLRQIVPCEYPTVIR